MYKNSDDTHWNMYIISWRIIYNLLDIIHLAHITGNWKILISCHMCAYQTNNIIFGFFQAMQFCHTIIPVTAINLEEAIHSRTFFWDSGNFSVLQLCCKSRAKSKIEMKKLCCVFTHDLTFILLKTRCSLYLIGSATLTLLERIQIPVQWINLDMRTYGTKSIFFSCL